MRTFNFWQVVLPLILVGSFVIGFFRITVNAEAKGLTRLLQSRIFCIAYIVIGGIACMSMLVIESFNGVMEFCKQFTAQGDSPIWLDLHAMSILVGTTIAYGILLALAMALGSWARPKHLRKKISFEEHRERVIAEKTEPQPRPVIHRIGYVHPSEILSIVQTTETSEVCTPVNIGLHTTPETVAKAK